MPLNESPDVNQLDTQIFTLQQQLSELHKQRLAAMRSTPTQHIRAIKGQSSFYRQLAKAWAQHGVTIPAEKVLRSQLKKAAQINLELIQQHPELLNNMQITLVPPAAILNKILKEDALNQKQFIFDEDVEPLKKTLKWRVALIYSAPHGLPLDSYLFAHRQGLSDLGTNEYLSLVIQEQLLIDLGKWTLLLKQTANNIAPCAAFANGSYRFVSDEIESVFNDNTFRPCIEVKV